MMSLYKEIFDISDQLICITDAEFNIQIANSQFSRTFAFYKAALTGRSLLELVYPDDLSKFQQFLQRSASKSSKGYCTCRFHAEDSPFKLISWTINQLSSENRFCATGFEISAEQSGESGGIFFAEILNTMGQALIITDEYGTILYYNSYVKEIYGWEFDQIIGKSALDVLSSGQFRISAIEILETLRKGNSWKGEFISRHRVGHDLHVHLTLSPVLNSRGELLYTVGISKDISKRKELEKKLQENRRHLSALINSNDAFIWSLDSDYRFTIGNTSFNNLIKKLRGSPFTVGENVLADCFPPESLNEFKIVYDKALKGNSFVTEISRRVINASNTIQYHFHPILNNDGQVEGVVVFGLDITDQKQSEEKLKAALREKELVMHELHHRVQNNLQLISSLLQLQIADSKEKKITDSLNDSLLRVRAIALVHDTFQNFNTLPAVDIDLYLTTVVSSIFQTFGSEVEQICWTIEADPVVFSMKQANYVGLLVTELITNSIKHAFPGKKEGQIQINLTASGAKNVQLTYADNGIGIPDHIDWRNPKSLGLKIISLLIKEQLHGSIMRERTPGTCFKINFSSSGEALIDDR